MAECPNCSGSLRFDIKTQQLACDYCGSFFDPYAVSDVTDAENDCFDVNIFRCPNCLGELYTTDESATGFCSYCGSSVILESRIAKEKRPSYIIPFKITKEDCLEILDREMKAAIFTPRKFRDPKKLEQFRGIYMPYWVYNTTINNKVRYNAKNTYTKGNYDYEDFYMAEAKVNAQINGLTADASSSFDDSISEAIAPFPAKELKKFTPSYLCGFYGDIPDVDASVYAEDAAEIVSGALAGSFKAATGERLGILADQDPKAIFPSTIPPNIEKCYAEPVIAQNIKAESTMLPVWFLSYRNGNRVAYAVVNGVTGTVSYDLPVSLPKFLLTSLIVAIPFFLILNFFLVLTPPEALCVTCFLALFASSIFYFNAKAVEVHENHEEDRGFRFTKYRDATREVSREISSNLDLDQKTFRMAKAAKDGTPLENPNDSVKIIKVTKDPDKISITPDGDYVPAAANKSTKKSSSPFDRLVLILVIASLGLVMAFILMALIMFFHPRLILFVYGAVQVITTLSLLKKKNRPLVNIPLRLLPWGSALAGFLLLMSNSIHDEYYYILMLIIYIAIMITLLLIFRQMNIMATRPLPQLNRKGGDDSAPE